MPQDDYLQDLDQSQQIQLAPARRRRAIRILALLAAAAIVIVCAPFTFLRRLVIGRRR